MTDNKKPAFPQTPDGVTDWEQVFEGPNGLIALITQVRSAAALRECTLVIIGQLFTRKQDQLEVARLTRQLDSLIVTAASQDITGLSTTIIGLLRQIKRERIEKARDYLADKQKKPRKNRRSESVGNKLSNRTYRLINNQKISIMAGGAAFILLMAVLAVVINVYTDGKLIAALSLGGSAESVPQVEQTEQPAEPKTKNPEPEQPTAPASKKPVLKDNKPEMPPAIIISRIFLPRLSSGPQKGSEQVLPILVLASSDDLSDLCRIQPVVLDTLNTQMDKLQGRRGRLKDTDLTNVGFEAMNRLNARLRRTAVVKVLLVRGADHRDRASRLCSQAPEKFLKYINKIE